MAIDSEKLVSLVKSALVEKKHTDDIGPMRIPDSKEELLDFLSMLRPQMRKSEILVDVYEEAVFKAQRLFPGDPDFDRYVSDFEERINSIRKELKEQKDKEEEKSTNKILIMIFIYVLLACTIGIFATRAM